MEKVHDGSSHVINGGSDHWISYGAADAKVSMDLFVLDNAQDNFERKFDLYGGHC